MIKRIKTLVLTTALISTQIYAREMGTDTAYSPYDGFYVGANIGLSNLLDKESHVNPSETLRLGALGIIGGGYVGYDYSISDRVKLGVEIFGDANGLNTSIQHYNVDSSYHVSSRYSVGFRFLPGLELAQNTIAHVILGYSNTQFQIKDNGTFGYINNSVHKSGFQSGLGCLVAITPSFLLRFDGMYTTFMSETSRGISAVSPNYYQYYTNDLSTFEGDLSLVYKFNW